MLVIGCFAASVEAAYPLMAGEERLGTVSTVKQGADILVSLQDMASLLGLGTAVKGDTLAVTSNRSKAQFVSGASAAWLDVELVPLAAPCVEWKGRWLLDGRSALKMFTLLLNRSGRQVQLSFGPEEPDGTAPPPVAEVAPSPVADKPSPPAKVEVTTPAPVVDVAPPATPVPVTAAAKDRPVLKGIRWGEEGGKLRAVMDCEGEEAPEVQRGSDGVRIYFSSGQWPVPGTPSPYGDVKVNAMHFGDRILVEFISSIPVHEVMTLESPKRLVIDFMRPGGVSAPRPVKPSPGKPVLPSVPPGRGPSGGRPIVVIDPGHGGKDPGAVGNGIREKDLNLAVSKRLAARLKELGIDARLTRDTDVYLTLRRRTEIANEMNAELFVSVHGNALPPGRSATGMEIYIMALPTDKDAMELARLENREIGNNGGDAAKAADQRTQMLLNILGNMQQNAKISESTGFAEYLFKSGNAGGIKMRRVAQAPFFVLRGAAMPSVLIELGFITDKNEAKLLADGVYQAKMANSLAKGIQDYLKNH
ncbi:MAG: N-acetylmuramoyl-L-alanine amidase [Synergistaceae bacterium]|nr:N-acetylmuramoyl-L-alanine amidase [Synergistota bacterium]NLM71507.1 N-acetylmuramoyl-L-alanine amidase [Synergistaceae bacterium]